MAKKVKAGDAKTGGSPWASDRMAGPLGEDLSLLDAEHRLAYWTAREYEAAHGGQAVVLYANVHEDRPGPVGWNLMVFDLGGEGVAPRYVPVLPGWRSSVGGVRAALGMTG